MIPTLEKIIRRRSGQILLPLMVSALSPRASIGPIARAAVSWQAPEIPLWNGPEAVRRRGSRPRRLLDRRSPAGLGVGDLRSAKWQGRETLQQLGPAPRSRASPGDSALPTRLSGQDTKFPELSTILKRLPSRRSPCRRSDFRRSVRGTGLVSYLLWRRS